MSLKVLAAARGFLLKVIIAITLSGCAASRMELTLIDEKPAVQVNGHQVSNCRSTQRDLTIPWSLRQYWCGETKRREDLQTINNAVMDQIASKSNHSDQIYIDEINEEVNKGEYVPDDSRIEPSISPEGRSLNRDDALKRLKSDENSRPINITPEPQLNSEAAGLNKSRIATDPKSKNAIIFAKNLRTLGPQGRAATHGLIEQVSASDRVLIRGLILPDEVLVDSSLYREKVSVGRALAVRQYWQEQGLDTSHITILHHDHELSGRVVEVVFNG